MKKEIFFFFTVFVLFPLGLDAQCTGADFEEQNGIVVIQMESTSLATGWNEETGSSGFTGDSFIAWRGNDFFNTPGNGVISYTVRINTPGEYRIQWRSRVGIGTNSTEHNDSWLRLDDADSFFGRRASDGGLVFPRDRPGNPKPNGASSDGWLKAYLNGTTNWTWSTLTSDEDGHEIFATFNTAGVYTVEVSGRSNGHFIDRMVLYQENQFSETQATDLARDETLCTNTGPDCSNLMLSLNPTPTTTCDGTDGSIVSNVTGAQGDLTYSWSNGATTSNISGLAPGSYTLDILDAAGCPASATIAVGAPDLPNVSLDPFANVSESEAVFALSGGSPAGGSYSGTGVSNNMFDPAIGTGTYTITYTFTDGTTQCTNTATQTITVTGPDCSNLMLSLNPTPTTTCGGTDGSIVSNVTGAQGDLTYSWSNGATTPNISGLAPGSYTLDILDGAGCPASATIAVGAPDLPNVSLDPFANVSESEAVFALSGGSPAGGSYSGTGVSNNMFDPAIGAGTYTITYTFTDGTTQCTNTATQNITVTAIVIASITDFILIDTQTDTDISNLSPNQEFILEDLPAELSIRAETDTNPIGSVFLELSGPINATAVENLAPFSIFGNINQDFTGMALPIGAYSITGTPYSGPDQTGVPGVTFSIAFSIITNPCIILPDVSLAPFSRDLAEFDTPISLNGGLPEGGTYSGIGVTDNSFDPSVAGPGTFTISYEFINSEGCSNTATQLITVLENANDTIFIFPNPIVDGRYRIKIPGNATGPLDYGIYDATGKAVKIGSLTSTGNFIDFNVSDVVLQQGIYRLVIEGSTLERPITISFLNN